MERSKKTYEQLKRWDRKYRFYRDLSCFYKEKIFAKQVPFDEFFDYSLKYELAYTFSTLSFVYARGYHFHDEILLRRLFEGLAIYNFYKKDKLEDIDLKIFKYGSLKHEIGAKEQDRIRKKLLLSKKINVEKLVCSNKFLFLAGHFDEEISFKKIIEQFEVEDFDKVYDLLSINLHHNASIFIIGNKIESNRYLTDEMQKDIDQILIEKKTLSKKLVTPSCLELNVDRVLDYLEIANKASTTLTERFNNHVINYLFEGMLLLTNTITLFDDLIRNKKYIDVLILTKSVFEKCSIFNHLIKMNNHDASYRYACYVLAVRTLMDRIMHRGETSEELEEELKKCYKDYKKYAKSNKNYYDFKELVLGNPSYVIFDKSQNFTSIARNFINNTCSTNKEKAEKLYSIYLYSVGLSHCDGQLSTKEDFDYEKASKSVLSFIIDFTVRFLDKTIFVIKSFENRKGNAKEETIEVIEEFKEATIQFEQDFKDDNNIIDDEDIEKIKCIIDGFIKPLYND